MQNIVNLFEQAAELLEYKFIYGAQAFINYDVSDTQLTQGEILIAMFPLIDQAVGIAQSNKISLYESSTTIWVGRKFDHDQFGGTVSELDETNYQKYTRRLYDLRVIAENYIESVVCGQNIELTSLRMTEAINQTNENIDFIACEIRIRHERGYE